MGRDLFSCALDDVTEDDVRDFVDTAFDTRVQAESLILELKSKPSGTKVVDAVAAMANTDGGLVIVGVDEHDKERFPGLSRKEIDSVGQQLRALVPDVPLESRPVALAETKERALLILRVTSDLDRTPIVFNGQVLVRRPGQSVGARRDEVIELVQRTQASTVRPGLPLMDVGGINPWDTGSQLDVRVGAVFSLSRGVAARDWLGTPAVSVMQDALHSSPIPTKLWGEHHRSHELGDVTWQPVELSHFRVRFDSTPCRPIASVRPALEALCIVQLSGSILDIVLSVRPVPSDTKADAITLDHLHEAMLASALTTIAVGVAVTENLGDPRPAPPPVMAAWVGGSPGLELLQHTKSWTQIGDPAVRAERRFDPQHLRASGADHADSLVRQWLAHLLAGRGILGFEGIVEDLEVPSHL